MVTLRVVILVRLLLPAVFRGGGVGVEAEAEGGSQHREEGAAGVGEHLQSQMARLLTSRWRFWAMLTTM